MPIISIDFFGSLNKKPVFWRELLKFAKLEGTKIYVISGPWQKDIVEKLEFSGYTREVHYDSVYSILSHLGGKGLDTWFDEDHDSWYSEKNDWWNAKAEICRKINCQTHFDSDIRFAKAFESIPTRFVHIEDEGSKCLINQWRKDLFEANTFDDWEDGYMSMMSGLTGMGGIPPI